MITDDISFKATTLYIVVKMELLRQGYPLEKYNYRWAKAVVEDALQIVLSGSSQKYKRKGAFTVYFGQPLTPENCVYMDMFELLFFGDNDFSTNRATELRKDTITEIKTSIWSIFRLLTSNDYQTRMQKEEIVKEYIGLFGE